MIFGEGENVIDIDIEGAKERFMGCEPIYTKHLYKMPLNNSYQDGIANISEGKIEDAFREMHAFKGVVANLSLNDLYHLTSDIVEDLRAGKEPAKEQLDALDAEYRKTVVAIKYMERSGVSVF